MIFRQSQSSNIQTWTILIFPQSEKNNLITGLNIWIKNYWQKTSTQKKNHGHKTNCLNLSFDFHATNSTKNIILENWELYEGRQAGANFIQKMIQKTEKVIVAWNPTAVTCYFSLTILVVFVLYIMISSKLHLWFCCRFFGRKMSPQLFSK